MKLSRNEFKILSHSLSNNKKTSQRTFSSKLGLSLGTVNSLIRKLSDDGLVNQSGEITEKGKKALEPYKVDNAIIMAAGMSSRFAPLSYEKPKGLFEVKGEILIERQIRQLQESGIKEICIVVGYMQEKFFYLQEKFNVDIVVNEDYYRYNNTSSLIRVVDKLQNTYICSSDDYFMENVFEQYVYDSYYASSYQHGESYEWGIVSNQKGRIVQINHKPKDMYIMLGHVYFSRTFSHTFASLLKEQYKNNDIRINLWEHLLENNLDKLEIYERRYGDGIINEFDSLDELRAFDKRYINDSGSIIFKNISRILDIEEADISDIEILKNGLTNLSFCFTAKGKGKFVYRHPGKGTDKYISRKSEAFSENVAKKLGLDKTIVYIDAESGWKISKYVENASILDYHNDRQVSNAIELLRTLHAANIKSEFNFGIWNKIDSFERMIPSDRILFEDYDILKADMKKLWNLLEKDGNKSVLCHCDSYSPNFLISEHGEMSLIDWEYSGNDDPASDVGTFICCSDWDVDRAEKCIREYLDDNFSNENLRHFIGYVAVASYYWFVWALYQESIGNLVGEWLYLWYKNTKIYMNKAFGLYSEGD